MSIDLSSTASTTLRQDHQPVQNDLIFAFKAEKKMKCENSIQDFTLDEKQKNNANYNAYYNTACYQDSFPNSSLNSKSIHSNKSSISSNNNDNNNNNNTKSNAIRPSNQNILEPPRIEPVLPLKQTSSNFKLTFYKYLLSAIKFAILFAQMFQIYLFQFIYFIRIQYEQKIKRRYFDNGYLNDVANNLNSLVSPTHVCVILNQDEKDVETIYGKLALLAKFFSSKGVKYLSFYKFEGVPLEVKERLTNEFHDIDFNNNNNSKNSTNTFKNEHLKNRFESKSATDSSETSKMQNKIRLNFLSYANGGGKDVIVKTCKKISNKIKQEQLQLSDLSQDLIDTQILESTDLIEPELIINIGIHDTVVGFSPWHIRLSEIIETNDALELDEVQVEIIINKALNSLFGEIGMTGLMPKILKFDSINKKLILEVTDKGVDGLRQALCLTDGTNSVDVNATKLAFKILNASKFLSNIECNSRNDFF